MGAVFRTCRSRGLIVVLATGTTISLTALTGGIAPALADPGGGSSITTPVMPPHSPGGGSAARPGRNPDVEAAPQQPRFVPDAPSAPPAVEVPPKPQVAAPKEAPVAPVAPVAPEAPVDNSPPPVFTPPKQQQAPPEAVAPPPVIAPPKQQEAPPAAVDPKPVTTTIPSAPKPVPHNSSDSSGPQIAASPKAPPPQVSGPPPPAGAPPLVSAPPSVAAGPPSGPSPAISPQPSAPQTPAVEVSRGPNSAPPAAGPSTVVAEPTPNLAGPPSPPNGPPGPSAKAGADPAPTSDSPVLVGKGGPADRSASNGRGPGSQNERVLEVRDGAKLQAPEADIELAKASKPVEQKPDPAAKAEVDDLKNALASSRANAGDREFDRPGQPGFPGQQGFPGQPGRSDHPDWNKPDAFQPNWDRQAPRQWDRNWVQYDDYYRPVLFNPYHQTVKIIYVYQNQPRIVWIPPLARIVLNAIEYAAYSFTALVVDTIGTVVNAAVGTFFGGGYYPDQYYGAPPPPPPPLQSYNQVPVYVNYSNASYQPFLAQRVVDVGDDAVYGEHKVLLDGVTPVWGQWTQTADGQRQFEVHKTQQFPGLDDPREGPLPGDYQLQLANTSSDESAGYTAKDVWAIAGSGVVGALGLSWLLSYLMSRRRSRELY